MYNHVHLIHHEALKALHLRNNEKFNSKNIFDGRSIKTEHPTENSNFFYQYFYLLNKKNIKKYKTTNELSCIHHS